MTCPNCHASLTKHVTTNHKELTVAYHECPRCGGAWLTAFDANYIDAALVHEKKAVHKIPKSDMPACAVCSEALVPARGDSIPPGVTVGSCPKGHGYYFPSGELSNFKRAQEVKRNYFQLWGIPLPSLSSVLLASVTLFIMAGGFWSAYRAMFTFQSIESQAQRIFVSEKVYVSESAQSVAVSAMTAVKTTVTIHIPNLRNMTKTLTTTNGLFHTTVVNDVAPGSYTYFFTYEVGGVLEKSDTNSFVMH